MYWVFLASAVIVAYLCGSVNFAIIVSTLVHKGDIRDFGTHNPGTANTARKLGKGWGAVVFFGDIGKAIVPLIIAEELLFSFATFRGCAGLILMAIAAILGHRKPVFFGFRGGGGLATTIGAMGFFIPIELFISLLVGFGIGMMISRSREQRLGRWVAMTIVVVAPVVNLVVNLLFDVGISGRFALGGQEWYQMAGIAILALYVGVTNARLILEVIGAPPRASDG